MRHLAAGLGLALLSCYAPSPPAGAPCSEDEHCPSGLTCTAGVCERDTGDGTDSSILDPDAPAHDGPGTDGPVTDAQAIDACPAAACEGSNLVGCGAPVTCDNGCGSGTIGTPHCLRIHPSNQITWEAAPAPTSALVLPAGMYTLDTTSGVISGDAGAIPVATTLIGGMRVVVVSQLTIQSGATLAVVGTPPLVLLVAGAATIDGNVTALGGCAGSDDPTCAGPGAGSGLGGTTGASFGVCGTGQSGSANTPDNTLEQGGGGGGYGTAGSVAGTGSALGSAAGGSGGGSCGTVSVEPLIGGGGGGAGGIDGSGAVRIGGRGGGGGGALQLTVDGTLEISGAIDVGGAGGETGSSSAGSAGTDRGGGGGGGAGGAILLESRAMTIIGTLAANGGGGGGNLAALTGNGARGSASAACAPGGAGAPVGSGSGQPGGTGGCATTAPTSGGASRDRGGGGGAVGRIRINNTSLNVQPSLVVSPAASGGSATFD